MPATDIDRHIAPSTFHGIVSRMTRRPLAIILVLTAVCWLPYFSRTAIPFHDSASVYESFHFVYSEAFFTGELARWIPYGNYGVQADLTQGVLHPTALAVGAIGLLAGARDTLLLSKIAVLLNEALYGFGLFLLSRELYSRRLTQFLITLTGVLSVSWMQQVFLNLNVFYLLPLVLYLVVRFFRTGTVAYVYLAGLVEICSFIGGVPYFASIHLLVLALFAIPLACQSPGALKSLIRPRNLLHPGLWGMAVVGFVMVAFLAGGLDGLAILSPDRDPNTGRVSQDTFVNYARFPVATTVFGFVTGGVPHGDNTYYVGLLTLVMFAYSLIAVEDGVFLGIASGFAALCWLSIGGLFAKLLYQVFPGMNLFRHVGLVFGLAGLLLILGSGYGIDRLVQKLAGSSVSTLSRPRRRYFWLALVVALMLADLWCCRRPDESEIRFWLPGWKLFFVIRALIAAGCLGSLWLLHRVRTRPMFSVSMPSFLLAAACLLDLGSFRTQVLWTMPGVSSADLVPGMFEVDRLPYLAQRSDEPAGQLAEARLQLFSRPLSNVNNVSYAILNMFARFDPCQPNFRTDIMSRPVREMIEARGGVPISHPTDAYLPAHDQAFKASLGCGAPKIRLTRRVRVARSEPEAKILFAALPHPDATVVLLSDDPSVVDQSVAEDEESPGTVEVTAFSSNRIRIHAQVQGTEAAWLVSADAWRPGWKAAIDGKSVSVIRANLGFKAVLVKTGIHDVEFVYNPRRQTWLAWCHLSIGTSAGLILCGAMLVTSVRLR